MQKAIITATGTEVNVISVSGGWSTVEMPDGSTTKVRNSALTAADTKAVDHQSEKEIVMTEAIDTTEAATAAPRPPVRAAAPAHFVGDTTPGKVAKVKDTVFNMDRYFVSDVKTAGGRRTIDCADTTAEALRGMPIDSVYAMAAETLGVTVEALQAQYGHLNLGMQRMNLGNRIRGAAGAKEKAAARLEAAARKEASIAARAEARLAKEAAAAEAKAEKEAAAAAKAAEREAAKAAKEAEKAAAAEAKAAEKAAKVQAKADAKAAKEAAKAVAAE